MIMTMGELSRSLVLGFMVNDPIRLPFPFASLQHLDITSIRKFQPCTIWEVICSHISLQSVAVILVNSQGFPRRLLQFSC